uniref:Uncharacterized protein n=1 Tax=Moniliophthora roreri TaxID=221103 RepID=A0A0W0F2M9_MONRR
MRESLRETPQR